jgi:hypothetical protein
MLSWFVVEIRTVRAPAYQTFCTRVKESRLQQPYRQKDPTHEACLCDGRAEKMVKSEGGSGWISCSDKVFGSDVLPTTEDRQHIGGDTSSLLTTTPFFCYMLGSTLHTALTSLYQIEACRSMACAALIFPMNLGLAAHSPRAEYKKVP